MQKLFKPAPPRPSAALPPDSKTAVKPSPECGKDTEEYEVVDEKAEARAIVSRPPALKALGKRPRTSMRLSLRGAYGSISTDSSGWLGAVFSINDVNASTDFSTFKTVFDSFKVHGMLITFQSIGPSVTNHIPFATAFDVDNYGGTSLSLGNISSTVLRYSLDSKETGVRYHHTRDLLTQRKLKFPTSGVKYQVDTIIGSTNTLLVKPGEWCNVDNTGLVNVGYLYMGSIVAGPSSAPVVSYSVFWDVEFANRS